MGPSGSVVRHPRRIAHLCAGAGLAQAACGGEGGLRSGEEDFGGLISSSVAASAHIPRHKPMTPHTAAEWPRRPAITAVSGASATLIAAEVTSRLTGLSL